MVEYSYSSIIYNCIANQQHVQINAITYRTSRQNETRSDRTINEKISTKKNLKRSNFPRNLNLNCDFLLTLNVDNNFYSHKMASQNQEIL